MTFNFCHANLGSWLLALISLFFYSKIRVNLLLPVYTYKEFLLKYRIMKKYIFLVITLAFALFSFQTCKKDMSSDSSSGTNLSASLKTAVAEVVSTQVTEASIEDVHSVSVEKFDGTDPNVNLLGAFLPKDSAGRFKNWGSGSMHFDIPHISSCATITVSSATYPKVITIDYGTGCSDGRGPVKKGKIIISLSDTIINAGAIESIAYDNFSIDGLMVERADTVKNLGENSEGHWVIQSSAKQTVTKTGGDKIYKQSNETLEWTSGFGTADKSDDIYYKTGSGSISVNDSSVSSQIITKPLLIDRSCQYITSGTIELTRNGTTTTIDYGDGTCDNKATVTVNGTTEEIDLFTCRFGEDGLFGKNCHGFGGNGNGRFGF
jgi:hypothetical protein